MNLAFATNAGAFHGHVHRLWWSAPGQRPVSLVITTPAVRARRRAGVPLRHAAGGWRKRTVSATLSPGDSTHTVTAARRQPGAPPALQGRPLTVTLSGGVATVSAACFTTRPEDHEYQLTTNRCGRQAQATSNSIVVSHNRRQIHLVFAQQPTKHPGHGRPFNPRRGRRRRRPVRQTSSPATQTRPGDGSAVCERPPRCLPPAPSTTNRHRQQRAWPPSANPPPQRGGDVPL